MTLRFTQIYKTKETKKGISCFGSRERATELKNIVSTKLIKILQNIEVYLKNYVELL